LRTFNASQASLATLARVVATLITDAEAGSYNGSSWAVTGLSAALRRYNCLRISVEQLLRVVGTIVRDNTGTTVVVIGGDITNRTADYGFDCTSTSLTEIANVLGTWMVENMVSRYQAAHVTGGRMDGAFVLGGRG
jgi:hypothetical protein